MNLFPSQIEEIIMRIPDLSPHFQCVLSRSGRLDNLTVRVEGRTELSGDAAAGPPTRSRRPSRTASA